MFGRQSLTLVLKNLIIFVLYFAAAKFFLNLTAVNSFASIIWPSAGIALAGVVTWGYAVLPAVTLGAFLANVSAGAPAPVALVIALGNTLETFAATYFLRSYIKIDPFLSRIRDVLGIIITAPLSAILSATVGVSILALTGAVPLEQTSHTWIAWWVGDAVSMLVMAPFLIRWLARPLFTKTRRELIEGIGLFAFLIAVNLITFHGPLGSEPSSSPLIYLTMLPLIWASLRSGPRGTTLAIFLTSAFALFGTLSGRGPFTTGDLPISTSLELLQLFKAMMAVTFLLFVAAVEERKEALRRTGEYVDKLEQAVYKINSADQAKNDFLAILAHELRNPLAPMVSAIELLKIEGAATPKKQELFDILDKQIRNVSRLLDDLLDVSRITKRKFKIQKEIVGLPQIIEHARQSVMPFMNERRHTLIVHEPPSVYLDADPLRIEQAFINLLNNAAKYTEQNGRINLITKETGDSVVIEVTDNGIGIEPHMLTKIFDPFVQASRSVGHNAGHGTGLGIGLSLTKRLVELHRGTIEAESKGVGHGSVFRVRLPLAPRDKWPQVQNQAELTFAQAASLPSVTARKVLIVDDNTDAAKGLSRLLRHRGHEVETAYDALSAISLVPNFRPDAIVLDIGLPDMDGYEAARQIRAAYGDSMTLIALTGYGLEEDKLRARMAGFNHHLTKPVGVADLERVLP